MASRRLLAVPVAVLFVLLMAIGPAFAQDGTDEPEATPEATEAPAELTPNVTEAPPATDVPTETFDSYTVQRGDTLANIGRRFNVPFDVLLADNAISNPDLIFAGQVLRIRTSGVPAPTATPLPPTPTPEPETPSTYVVQRGDTLFRIATRFGTTVNDLLALNNLANANLIFAGQTLIIRADDEGEDEEEDEEDAETPTSEPVATEEDDEEPVVEATAIPAPDVEFGYGIEAFASAQNTSEVAATIRELGMSWVKINVDWRDYEPVEGQMDLSTLDTIVSAMDAAGLDILFTVSSAPDWARSNTDESGPPDDYADFSVFVSALATRYGGGGVNAYEIWTEPNLRREWNSTVHPISPDEYLQLLQLAYAAIKLADPEATVISAGLAPTGFNDGINAINDRLYLEALYRGGLANFSDAVGAHPGGWANPPDAVCCEASVGIETHFEDPSFYFLETLDAYRTIMNQAGDAATAIWVTDFGWGTSEDMEAPPQNYIYVSYTSLTEQAIYTPRAFELGQELGYVGSMFLKNLNGCIAEPVLAELCYYSLIDPNGDLRPVFSSVQAIQLADDGSGEATEAPLLPDDPAATEGVPLDQFLAATEAPPLSDEPIVEAAEPNATPEPVG